MRIIDFHAHIYPDKIAEKATNATGDFYGITPACIGTSEGLLREGKNPNRCTISTHLSAAR